MKHYSSIYLERLRKITKHLSQDTFCEYKRIVLLLHQTGQSNKYQVERILLGPASSCTVMGSTGLVEHWGALIHVNNVFGCHCLFIIVTKRVVSLNKLNNKQTRRCNQNSGLLLLTSAFITAVTNTKTQ